MKHWMFAAFLPLALAGCGSTPPPETFTPLDYSYLPPIVLKVANLTVTNDYVPTPSQATLTGEDPDPPAVALLAMLNHRMVASGAPGSAIISIEDASIDQANGNLTGTLTVDVHVSSPDGKSTGYTEASVSASQTAPDADADQNDVQAALYGLTKQLMDNMNVELQYQIQHNLGSWLSWGAAPGAAPLATGAPASIQAAPLTPPATTTTTTTTTTGPAALVPPSTNGAVPPYLPGAGPAALSAPAQ